MHKNLSGLEGLVPRKALLKMENDVDRTQERFTLIDLFFKPCEDDGQYYLFLTEFIENHLRKAEILLEQCKMIREEKRFAFEDTVKEQIRKNEVNACLIFFFKSTN